MKTITLKHLLLFFCLCQLSFNQPIASASAYSHKPLSAAKNSEQELSRPFESELNRVIIRSVLLALGFFFTSLGLATYLDGHKDLDTPVTYQDKILYIIRSTMPKDELEKFLQKEQAGLDREKKIGCFTFWLGLALMTGGILV